MVKVDRVEGEPFVMTQLIPVDKAPTEERPLMVSLKPLRFQRMMPELKPCMVTLPLPKPFGITSLLLEVKLLTPDLFRAVINVSPAHELFVLASIVSPLTVDNAHNVSRKGPEIGPRMPPPPCPPISASPINVTG